MTITGMAPPRSLQRSTSPPSKVIALCHARHRQQEFLRFLDQIDRGVPVGHDVHLVLDN